MFKNLFPSGNEVALTSGRYTHSVRKIQINMKNYVPVREQGAKFKISALLGFYLVLCTVHFLESSVEQNHDLSQRVCSTQSQ